MQLILTIIGAFLIVAILGWLFIQTGFYNVSAVEDHYPLTKQIIEETLEHSVKHHAKGLRQPESMTDPAMLKVGFNSFDRMCVGCHGAPGVARRGANSGMNPQPPSLSLVAEEWKPEELYWIVRNGIKMTGMPAYGKTHDDKELWAITAFLLTLPNIEPEQYLAMRASRDSLTTPDSTRRPMQTGER